MNAENYTIYKPVKTKFPAFQTVAIFTGTNNLNIFSKRLCLHQVTMYHLKGTIEGNHKKWIGHGENHPNINHLNNTCPWE